MTEHEEQTYQFKEMTSKIVPKPNLKKHKNITRKLWSWLEENRWELLGVVREWTALFKNDDWHVAIHHFIDETPLQALIDKPEYLTPDDLIGDEETAYSVIRMLKEFGFTLTVPQQAFTEAFASRHLYRKS